MRPSHYAAHAAVVACLISVACAGAHAQPGPADGGSIPEARPPTGCWPPGVAVVELTEERPEGITLFLREGDRVFRFESRRARGASPRPPRVRARRRWGEVSFPGPDDTIRTGRALVQELMLKIRPPRSFFLILVSARGKDGTRTEFVTKEPILPLPYPRPHADPRRLDCRLIGSGSYWIRARLVAREGWSRWSKPVRVRVRDR